MSGMSDRGDGKRIPFPKLRMLLDGSLVEGTSGSGDGSLVEGTSMDVVDPATGSVLGRAPRASVAQMEAAIKAARRAFDEGPWRQTTGMQRGRILQKMAARIQEKAEIFAYWETLTMGKPLLESEYDVADTVACFEYFAGWANKSYGDVNPVPDNAISMTIKEPVGVCGLIIPWNYPLMMAAWKLAPALAAGCTMVLKPAEQTPVTALLLGEILAEMEDLPAGVVNIVTGFGEDIGAALASSPLVDKVAFTGSTAVGRSIQKASAASNLKKVTLELGGKSPNIIFEDADFEAALDGALFGGLVNQGEVCSAGSRLLIQKSVYPKFLTALTEKMKRIPLGSGLDRRVKMGPLVSREHLKRVQSHVEKAKAQGARLVCGGGFPEGLDPSLRNGFFLQPTLFADVTPEMALFQEEVFGPVLCATPFEDEKEAISLANQTRYGLAGAVWSRDIFRALRVVRAVRAGILWVNHMQPTYVEAPWGGYKESGTGRELGRFGMENFLENKLVHINLNEAPLGWYNN